MEAKDIPGTVEALTAQLEANARQIGDLLRQNGELEHENAELERAIILQNRMHAAEIRAKDEHIAQYSAMLDWLADKAAHDGFAGFEKGRYEYAYAREAATEAGREEPNQQDEREGFRRLVRVAMEAEAK